MRRNNKKQLGMVIEWQPRNKIDEYTKIKIVPRHAENQTDGEIQLKRLLVSHEIRE